MSAQVPPEARREIKFCAAEARLAHVMNWIKLHAAGFSERYPSRIVNNVYFDSYDLNSLDENLAGVSARAKVRYRWYGPSRQLEGGALEVKFKRNEFGWKVRFAVPETPYEPGSDWREVRSALQRQLSSQGRFWLASRPYPVIINRYRRDYWRSADSRIRITIDTHKVAWDQRGRRSPTFLRCISDRYFVMEFKFGREDHALAAQVLGDVPLLRTRHSKYVRSVEAALLE